MLRSTVTNAKAAQQAGLMQRIARVGLFVIVMKGGSSFFALFVAWALTRLMSPAEFGVYSYVFSLAVMVGSIGPLGVANVFVREVAVLREHQAWGELRGLLRWGTALATGALFASGGIMVLAGRAIDSGDERASWTTLASGAVLAVLFGAIATVGAVLRGSQRVVRGMVPDLFFRPVLFCAALGALLVVGATELSAEVALRYNVIATLAASLAGVAFVIHRPPTERHVATPSYRSRAWFGSAMSMLLAGTVITVNSQLDVVMMKALSTAADTGIYTISSRLSSVILFLLFAANVTLQPVVARLWATGARVGVERVLALSTAALTLAAAVGAVLLIAGRHMILATIGPEYASAANVMVILAIANTIAVAAGPVQQTLIMIGQERAFAITALVPTALNIVLNVLLIPRFGPQGAAVATAIAIVAQAVLQTIVLRWRTGIAPPLVVVMRMLRIRLQRESSR